MSHTFSPGEKVIKRNERDPRNYGEVMDIPRTQQKPGRIAVYFQRQVWIKPENLMPFDEWKPPVQSMEVHTGPSIRDYWTGAR